FARSVRSSDGVAIQVTSVRDRRCPHRVPLPGIAGRRTASLRSPSPATHDEARRVTYVRFGLRRGLMEARVKPAHDVERLCNNGPAAAPSPATAPRHYSLKVLSSQPAITAAISLLFFSSIMTWLL